MQGEGVVHALEKVLQPHSPGLEKLGSKLGYHTLWGQWGHGRLGIGEG